MVVLPQTAPSFVTVRRTWLPPSGGEAQFITLTQFLFYRFVDPLVCGTCGSKLCHKLYASMALVYFLFFSSNTSVLDMKNRRKCSFQSCVTWNKETNERATSAERNWQRTLLYRPLNIHVSHNYSPPPSCRCIICAILFAHFVDWASASCTRANQRETGQRRYGKGEPIEGIGSCQHGLVCYGPTKWLTPFNAKKQMAALQFRPPCFSAARVTNNTLQSVMASAGKHDLCWARSPC